MLIVNYSEDGVPYSDFEATFKVNEWIEINQDIKVKDKNINIPVYVSTENIINAFKLAIIRDQINLDDIKFQYKGIDLDINEYGVFTDTPRNYIDINMSILSDMIKEQVAKRKLKRQSQ